MITVAAKFRFILSTEARPTLRSLVRVQPRRTPEGRVIPPSEIAIERAFFALITRAGESAFREVAFAGKGFEIAHIQYEFEGLTLAATSHVGKDGVIEIEAGLGDASSYRSVVTAKSYQAFENAARIRDKLARRNKSRARW